MFIVYSKPNCNYCNLAKSLLTSKNLEYEERIIDVGQVKDKGEIYVTVAQLKEKVPEAKTVPQIFDGDILIGGYDSLKKYVQV